MSMGFSDFQSFQNLTLWRISIPSSLPMHTSDVQVSRSDVEKKFIRGKLGCIYGVGANILDVPSNPWSNVCATLTATSTKSFWLKNNPQVRKNVLCETWLHVVRSNSTNDCRSFCNVTASPVDLATFLVKIPFHSQELEALNSIKDVKMAKTPPQSASSKASTNSSIVSLACKKLKYSWTISYNIFKSLAWSPPPNVWLTSP